jgi:hypothetical protein
MMTSNRSSTAVSGQLVGDQARDQIDRRHGLGLHGGDAAQPQLS